ncbi:MAG TPA: hypothetical protein VIS99_07950 [Terrimicrobiaceae bacterium]
MKQPPSKPSSKNVSQNSKESPRRLQDPLRKLAEAQRDPTFGPLAPPQWRRTYHRIIE